MKGAMFQQLTVDRLRATSTSKSEDGSNESSSFNFYAKPRGFQPILSGNKAEVNKSFVWLRLISHFNFTKRRRHKMGIILINRHFLGKT